MLKFLFIISLISLVLGQVARTQFGNGVAITLLDISVGVLVGSWLTGIISKKDFPKNTLTIPILLFFTVGVITLLINSSHLTAQQFIASFLYALRWLIYALVYFVVKDFKKEFRDKIPNLLTVAGSGIVVLGFVQYFFYNNLRNLFYLQWDDHLYRMFSTFLDPNFAGVFFSLFLFLTISRISDAITEKYRRSIYIFSALSLMTLLAVILTYSRTALITLGVGTVSLLFLKRNRKMVTVFLLIAFFFSLLFSNVGVEGRNPFRTASSQERLRSMYIAIYIIEKNPVFGVGFNAYRYAQNRYGFRISEKWQVSHADAGTDNSFLFVLATTGIVGLSVYLFFWIRVIREIGEIREKSRLNDRAMVLASVVGILASSFFLNTLFYSMLMYWMWVLLAVTVNKKP